MDAGDLLFKKFFGPFQENEVKRETEKAHLIVKSFNLMGYDAVGVGDDDLSLGKETLLELSRKANFLFLSSNLVDEASKKLFFQPYVLKEVNGLRIGIFSLLSPDSFIDQKDIRRKGLIFRDPTETALNIVKELQPKTDLIILLSHLSYMKDVELSQAVTGIHFIVGSHTGVNLPSPPISNNTVILQTAPRGMYVGRLDLILHGEKTAFYNTMVRHSMENQLNNLNALLQDTKALEAQRAQWRSVKKEAERNLKQLQGKNEFTNTILALDGQNKDHPEIAKMVEAYRSKYPKMETP